MLMFLKQWKENYFNYIMTACNDCQPGSLELIVNLGSLGFSILFYSFGLILKGYSSYWVLTHYHFYLGKCVKLFAIRTKHVKSAKFYRIINEVPTILLVFIIFIMLFLSRCRVEIISNSIYIYNLS